MEKLRILYKDAFYQNLLKEGVYDPAIFKAIFMAGGPGSGKSYIAKKVTGGLGYKFISSDIAFEHFLNKLKMSHKLDKLSDEEFNKVIRTRNRAKELTKKIKASHEGGRLGLIFDGTGYDYLKIKKLRDEITKYGYDTYMIFVNTSLDVALERNQKRSRTVPEDVVIGKWKAVQENIGKFQNLFGSNFTVIDNNTPDVEETLDLERKQVMKFTKAPIKNPIAKQWIDRELELKNRLSK